jgi:hypothetical protein
MLATVLVPVTGFCDRPASTPMAKTRCQSTGPDLDPRRNDEGRIPPFYAVELELGTVWDITP